MTEEKKQDEVKKPLESPSDVPSDAPSEDQAKEVKPEIPKPKSEPKVADKVKDEKVVVPAKFKKLVDEIEKMSIVDLAELVKILEKKFGVSPMAVAVPMAGAANAGGAAPAEEKSEFTIELKSGGEQKINVIRVVREVTGKGLKEAKDLVDAAPKVLKENVKKAEAEEIKAKLEKAGASVELK